MVKRVLVFVEFRKEFEDHYRLLAKKLKKDVQVPEKAELCISGDISDRPDRYPFEVHLNCVLVYTARISRVPPQDFTDIICSVRNVAGGSLPNIRSKEVGHLYETGNICVHVNYWDGYKEKFTSLQNKIKEEIQDPDLDVLVTGGPPNGRGTFVVHINKIQVFGRPTSNLDFPVFDDIVRAVREVALGKSPKRCYIRKT